MLPDPKWLDVLKLPLRGTLTIAVASGALLILDYGDYVDFGTWEATARIILIVLFLVFSVLSAITLLEPLLAPLKEGQRQKLLDVRKAARESRLEAERAQVKLRVLARLDHLSDEEIHYVAECLRKKSPTFYTYVYSPPVTMLQGKGLVWTPGGQHHQDHYPFSFQDYVWDVLLEREASFIEKDDQAKARQKAEESSRRRRY